jgi:hypothetical protein
MDIEVKTTAVSPTCEPATKDLSDAVTTSVEREDGEVVRTVRVFGDNYRCNWWVSDRGAGPLYLNVGRIIKSKLLRATMTGHTLVVEDVSIHRPREFLSSN